MTAGSFSATCRGDKYLICIEAGKEGLSPFKLKGFFAGIDIEFTGTIVYEKTLGNYQTR